MNDITHQSYQSNHIIMNKYNNKNKHLLFNLSELGSLINLFQ